MLYLGLRVIYSECPIGYERYSLCCKTGVEYEYYYREKKRSRLINIDVSYARYEISVLWL